jgi:DNA-binding PadR family transcriptional regulator
MSPKHHRIHHDEFGPLAAMRHLRGGPFGGPFGSFGGGRGRARRGDVRAALLMLLSEAPRNGYQMMQAIEDRSQGRWRPSPGSVYPALAQLEDQGFVRASERDGAKLFEITDTGREHLAERDEDQAPWDEQAPGGEQFGEFRMTMMQTVQAASQVAQAGNEQQITRAIQLLADARRGLYGILAEDPGE